MLKLIKKAQKGNDKAFLTLFQKYEEDIYRMAYVYVKNEHDALDVVQETAYRSFKSIKNLKESKYLKTWLIRISISCSLDLLRKRKNVIQFKPELLDQVLVAEKENTDLEVTIQDLIEQLNENEKTVVMLRFYQDLTFKEVAEVLDLPLGTTKSILYRALDKLRGKLKEDDFNEQ